MWVAADVSAYLAFLPGLAMTVLRCCVQGRSYVRRSVDNGQEHRHGPASVSSTAVTFNTTEPASTGTPAGDRSVRRSQLLSSQPSVSVVAPGVFNRRYCELNGVPPPPVTNQPRRPRVGCLE